MSGSNEPQAKHEDGPHDLGELVDRLREAEGDEDRVSVRAVLEHVGTRSFGPLILLAGSIVAVPVIGDIPGVPTVIGIFVLMVSAQMLLGRRRFWLPEWLQSRAVARTTLDRTLSWTEKPVRFIDRLLRPRLLFLVGPMGHYVIAIACTAIALGLPLMEIVPFSAQAAGFALLGFGLALVAQDGLVALASLLLTAATFAGILYAML